MTVLIDTSFLLALADVNDKNHMQARLTIQRLNEPRLIPIPVLPELFYMVTKRVDYENAVRLFTRLRDGSYQLRPISEADMLHMAVIMNKYADAEFDFVDVTLMALAERLQIRRICTFDRRDFEIFKTTAGQRLQIVP